MNCYFSLFFTNNHFEVICTWSVHKIWPLPGLKTLNKHGCYTLDNRDHWPFQIPRDLQRGHAHKSVSLPYVPNRFKTQERCDAATREDPCKLKFVPDHLKRQRRCNEAATNNPYILRYAHDCFKNQEMCDTEMRINPVAFFLIPERFKTQEMCI